MLKKNELSDRRSCLSRAQNDEPIFVMRANDPIAPTTVRFWARIYGEEKAAQPGGMTDEQVAKQIEAQELAGKMERWRQENRA